MAAASPIFRRRRRTPPGAEGFFLDSHVIIIVMKSNNGEPFFSDPKKASNEIDRSISIMMALYITKNFTAISTLKGNCYLQ